MTKMIIAFLILFGLMFVAIQTFMSIEGEEKIHVAKVVGFSLVCATLALAFVALIVILL